jgi:predicted PurR-regulated permease PerM
MHTPSPPSPVIGRATPAIVQGVWVGVGVALGLGLLLLFLAQIINVLLVLFVAIVLAEGIRPLVQWLERARVPRSLAVLLIYFVGLALVGGLLWIITRPLLLQLANLLDNLPHYTQQLQNLWRQVQEVIDRNPELARLLQSLGQQGGGTAGQLVSYLVRVPLSVGSGIFNGIFVLTTTFFWLTNTDQLKPFVVGLFPPSLQPTVSDIISETGTRMGGYLRGVLVDMVFIGVVTGLALWLLGVPYALLLGLFAGLTEALPYIGPFLGGTAAALVALGADGPVKGIIVAALYFLGIQQFEGSVLVPIVMNRTVKLNPLVILLAVLIGGTVLGVIGAVLAVPGAIIVDELVTRVLAPAARHVSARWQAMQAPPPAVPPSVDPDAL